MRFNVIIQTMIVIQSMIKFSITIIKTVPKIMLTIIWSNQLDPDHYESIWKSSDKLNPGRKLLNSSHITYVRPFYKLLFSVVWPGNLGCFLLVSFCLWSSMFATAWTIIGIFHFLTSTFCQLIFQETDSGLQLENFLIFFVLVRWFCNFCQKVTKKGSKYRIYSLTKNLFITFCDCSFPCCVV